MTNGNPGRPHLSSRATASCESLERRRLLSAGVAYDAAAPIAGDGASMYSPAVAAAATAAWQSVPSANFSQINIGQFTNAELRFVKPLYWFSTVANSVVETTGMLPRGFINIKVWRDPADNQPYNARVLENNVAFAFFYATNRPWNPYYGNTQVRNRLEAILDYWQSMQNKDGTSNDGTWTEYSATNWSLAPTSFGLRTVVRTLELLQNGPAIDAGVMQRTVDATIRGLRALLKTSTWLNAGNNYSNQYSPVYSTAMTFARLYPQYASELYGYLRQRVPEATSKHQSPAGFMYEAGGPDFGYTLGTHQTNITSGWHELRGSEFQDEMVGEFTDLYEWASYNLVRQPNGSGYLTNFGVTSRTSSRFYTTLANPMSEFVSGSRFLASTAAEDAATLTSLRGSLQSGWGNWGSLPNPSSNSYAPGPFIDDDRVAWRPTEAERTTSVNALPYLASTRFNHQLADNRFPAQSTFVRRPSYYAALNTGDVVTSLQRYGLGLLWNPTFGTAVQNQSNNDASSWGTKASGASKVYEASDMVASFTVNSQALTPAAGSTRLADGNVSATYALGTAGSKTVTFGETAVTVAVSHTGSFTETIPLLKKSGETISVSTGRISLTRGNVTLVIDIPTNFLVSRNTPGISVGDGLSVENFVLSGSGSLTYSLRFDAVLPPGVNGDRDYANQPDTFRLVRNGSATQVFLNSAPAPEVTWDAATGPASPITLYGLGGNDTFVVDLSGGNSLPPSGLYFDGGTGTGNAIAVTGGSGAETVTLVGGQVRLGSTGVTYANLQAMTLNLGAGGDTLVVNGNADVTTSALALNVASGGSVKLGSVGLLPDFADLVVDGTFDINGQHQTIDSLTGSGTVTNSGPAAAELTAGQYGGGGTFAGSINNGTAAVGFNKAGTGTLVLTGTSNYTGNTNVIEGTLRVTSAAALGSTAAGTWVQGGTNTGRLELSGGITLAEPITLAARAPSTFTGPFAAHLVNVTGSNTISGNVVLRAGGLGYTIQSDTGTLTITGNVQYLDIQTYDRPIQLRGGGTGIVQGAVRGNSGFDLAVQKYDAGTWTLAGGVMPSGSATTATADTTVNGGTLVVGGFLAKGHVTVDSGLLRLASASTAASVVTAVSIVNGGTLDLTDDPLVIDYAGTSSPAATVRGYLQTGRAGGTWTGAGIRSSAAAATPHHAIAYLEASAFGLTEFAEQAVDPTALLLKYTWAGDANVNGQVDGDDYLLADRGRAKALGTWVAGDFNYDGAVTDADLSLLDGAFTAAAAEAAGPQPLSTVASPEPAAVASLSIPALAGGPTVTGVKLTGPAQARRGVPALFTIRTAPPTQGTTAQPPRYAIDWDGDGRDDQLLTGRRTTRIKHRFVASGLFNVQVRIMTVDGHPLATSAPLAVRVP